MTEPEPIYVRREDYEEEEAAIYGLDSRLAQLEEQYDAWVLAHQDRLIVSREEFMREQEEVRLSRRELTGTWSLWGHYLATYRWLRRRERIAVLSRIPPISWSYLNLIRSSRASITRIQGLIREEVSRIERKLVPPPEILRLQAEMESVEAELNRERERFQRKIVVELERWGDEETTGYTIYYDRAHLNYPVYDPSKPEKPVRIEDSIVIEATASIDTDVGHDVPIALEITAITTVEEMDLSTKVSIVRRDGPIESAIISWLEKIGWGALARAFDTIGYAYIGKTQEPNRMYPQIAPDYPKVAVWVERRSRFVKYRRYPSRGASEIE